MLDHATLAVIFVCLMGLAILLYAILDGYDLGVGVLLPLEEDAHSDRMIASIGPFWDANETWLVLAVGLLLIAFPAAHNILLRELYLPATIMLIGLILRGVAFDFRAKCPVAKKPAWNKAFKYGSILTALTQGYMLGMYVMGFATEPLAIAFAILSALGVLAAYSLIGAAWLVMKTQGQLQLKAIAWAQKANWCALAGVAAVSLINPLINADVFQRWFATGYAAILLPIPMLCFALFVINNRVLKRLPLADDAGCWLPFVLSVNIFLLCFVGLALSFFPDIVPGQLTIWAAASAPESLLFIFWGALVVVPVILLYTIFSYRVFWGKATDLRYY